MNIVRSRGVTLIELLVSVAIGLILAASASYLFVSTQRSSKALDARAQQSETAAVVLDFIGRDLKNAGFFPTMYPGDAAVTSSRGEYSNIVDVSKPAFNQGIFGCSNAVFNPVTGLCPAVVASAPDSLVVNYFSSDTFNIDGVGTRRDCLRQKVETGTTSFNSVAYNTPRASSPTYTATAILPLFISNVYSLGASTTVTQNGQPISTRSFRCAGNGNPGSHQPLFPGVEELQFRYGVNDGTLIQAPTQFYTATQVSAMGNVTIDGTAKSGWQRVQAVQVCIVAKTLDNSARQVPNTGSYVNCEGTTISYTSSDRSIYQRLVRVFGVRNNLTTTF
jgi:type IV pilus assembly protein PilW